MAAASACSSAWQLQTPSELIRLAERQSHFVKTKRPFFELPRSRHRSFRTGWITICVCRHPGRSSPRCLPCFSLHLTGLAASPNRPANAAMPTLLSLWCPRLSSFTLFTDASTTPLFECICGTLFQCTKRVLEALRRR